MFKLIQRLHQHLPNREIASIPQKVLDRVDEFPIEVARKCRAGVVGEDAREHQRVVLVRGFGPVILLQELSYQLCALVCCCRRRLGGFDDGREEGDFVALIRSVNRQHELLQVPCFRVLAGNIVDDASASKQAAQEEGKQLLDLLTRCMMLPFRAQRTAQFGSRPESPADQQIAHHVRTYILLARPARLAKGSLLKASSARYVPAMNWHCKFGQIAQSYHSPCRDSFRRVALQIDSRITSPAAATFAIQLLVVVPLLDVAEHLAAKGLEGGHRVDGAVVGGISRRRVGVGVGIVDIR